MSRNQTHATQTHPTKTHPTERRPAQTQQSPARLAPAQPTLYDLDQEGLGQLLDGQPAYRVRQVWDGLYRQARRPEEMTDLPKAVRARLAEAAPLALHPAAESATDDGETVKTLWSLGDGARVESVLMHYPRRTTVCVSSQAGCAMACGFCATGQAGFQRHLTSGEIVEQVMQAIRRARPRRLDNVVLMGMGEPLANYDRVWAALRRLHDHAGLGARHLTVSTVGVVPGIRAWQRSPSRSTWPCPCTRPMTGCVTSWCRSTSGIRSTR